MNLPPRRFPHHLRVFFVGLVLAFAAALTCPQPTLAASPTAKPLAGEPDEALWERFVQAWAMPKDTPEQLEAKLATFVGLKDIAEAHHYELFAFKTWNAIRIHYDILERPTEDRIHVTLKCNEWARRLSRTGSDNITMLTNLYSLYLDVGKVAKAQQVYRRMLDLYGRREGLDADGHPRFMNPHLGYNHFLSAHVHHLQLIGKPEAALAYHTRWLRHATVSPMDFERFDSKPDWHGKWSKGTIVNALSLQADLLDYLDRREEAQSLRRKILDDYVLTEGYQSGNFYATLVDYLVREIMLRGPSPETGGLEARYLADHPNALFRVRLLQAKGETEAALDLLEVTLTAHLETFGANQRVSKLESLFRLRAELHLDAGDYSSVAEDLNSALRTARHFGRKLSEPRLYWLLGQYEHARGSFDYAFAGYRNAIQLYRKLGRPIKVIEVQVDLIRLYTEYGLFQEAAAL